MDKFEYELKVEQIEKLIKREDYDTAKKIADTMEWKKEKDAKLLRKVAELYYSAEEYAQALKILSYAYSVSSRGALILERMCEIAIISGKLDNAEEFCEEYRNIKGEDAEYYMFMLQIAEARGADINTQIKYLEKYCKLELDEEAMYRLAYLYDMAGMQDKCVSMCDFLIDFFCFGEAVDQAIELKKKYTDLDPYQEKKVSEMEAYERDYDEYLEKTEEAEDRRRREREQMARAYDEQAMADHEEELGKVVSEIVTENESENLEVKPEDLEVDEILAEQKAALSDNASELIGDAALDAAVAAEIASESTKGENAELELDDLEKLLMDELQSEIEASKEKTEEVVVENVEAAETVEEVAEDTAEEVTDTVEEAVEAAEEAAEEVTEDAVETVEVAEEVTEEAVEEAVVENVETAETVEEVTEEVAETAEVVEEAAEVAEEVTDETAEEVTDTVEEAVEAAEEVTEDAVEKVEVAEEVAAETVEEVTEEVAETAETVEEAVEEVTEEAAETAEAVEEAVEEVTEEVAETAEAVEEAAEVAEEVTEETAEEVTDTVEETVEVAEEVTEETVEDVTEEVAETAETVEEVAEVEVGSIEIAEDDSIKRDMIDATSEAVEQIAGDSNVEVAEVDEATEESEGDEAFMQEIEKTLAQATEDMANDVEIAIGDGDVKSDADENVEEAKLDMENTVVEAPERKKKRHSKSDLSALELDAPRGNFVVYADDAASGATFACELIRREDDECRPASIAKIGAQALNKVGFKSVEYQLAGDILLITDANTLESKTLDGMYSWLRKSSDNHVALVDTQKNIEVLSKRRPKMMKNITNAYSYESKSAAQWMDIVEAYVESRDFVLADDAKKLVSEYLDDNIDNGRLVMGADLKDALDTAMDHGEKHFLLGGAKLNEEGQRILRDKHFA
ncbi:MAG: tetratricopeptide repeat protein [Lachnospiraceae bacterium]|nr:tetratricopeptide repeat protein [Lachnospiraceae bacterium]